MRPLANIELNPTKPKMNPKKPDQIRSMMASVGAEPGRVTRDFMSEGRGEGGGLTPHSTT